MVRDRLLSLDAFRGLTIAAMIVVNNPAAEEERYCILRHAAWNGLRPADVIFPAFLFIAGVSITFSSAARRADGATTRSLLLQALRRSAIIFALGLLLNALPYFDWEIVRVPGVLQRIALALLGASWIALYWRQRGQAMWAASLLIVYAALMLWVPVPGWGAGVLEPDTNLAAYVDWFVLDGHMAHPHWDPEGLLGTLPAIASVLSGTLAGHVLITHARSRPGRVVSALLTAGPIAVLLGLLLAAWVPINKSLWSSSYVLVTSGLAAIAYALCFWLVDARRHTGWTVPFVVFGTNAIVVYWLSSFAAKVLELVHVAPASRSVLLETWLVDGLYSLSGSRPLAALLYALSYTTLWLALLVPLYSRRLFVKI